MMETLKFRDAIGSMVGTVNDIDSKHHSVQVVFPHDTIDAHKTVFPKGSFSASFRERLPIMCAFHNLSDPIGKATSARVLARHNEVIGRFSDLDKVPSARRVFSQLESRDLTDWSFGFVGNEVPHPDPALRRRGIRSIPVARMKEFGPCAIGSIPGATHVALRSLEGGYGDHLNADEHRALAVLDRLDHEAGLRRLRRGLPYDADDYAAELDADAAIAVARLDHLAVKASLR